MCCQPPADLDTCVFLQHKPAKCQLSGGCLVATGAFASCPADVNLSTLNKFTSSLLFACCIFFPHMKCFLSFLWLVFAI